VPQLSPKAIQDKLATLNQWKLVKSEIVREFAFPNFVEAIRFVNRVAEKAELAGHHPDIDIRYNKVRLAMVTHDAGGLTDRDFDLAASIDGLLI
jgi:4a-hydroxytetrahydrobiopterin dehydratase